MHRAHPVRAWFFAVQEMQKMAADGIIVGPGLDALAVMGEVMPVEQHRAQRSQQPVGDIARAGDAVIRLLRLQRASTDTPVRITSMGCALPGMFSNAARSSRGSVRSD